MNTPDVPLTQDLVLVGGGHAHALVLRKWGMNPLPGARLTVINPGPTAPYTGMLPGHVAGHYSRDTLEIDLVRLCRFAGARLILAHATDIDRTARLITVEGQGQIAYDVASIDIGITAEMSIAGFDDHAVGAKPLDVYAQRWREFVASVGDGSIDPNVAVIGGGVAGCELALAMSHALQQAGATPEITVIEAGSQISGVGDMARRKLMRAMSQAGISLRTDARVTAIEATQVRLEEHDPVAAALTVGAAGAFPHRWLANTDLPLIDGFIETTPDLSIKGDRFVFAVGDCAAMPFAPRPKAGVFAVRAAPVLHHNLRAALTGGTRKTFKPQKHYLKLISLGSKSAMAEKFGIAFSGPLLWRWKDRIDRAFMDKLDHLPQMKPVKIPDVAALGTREIMQDKPLCGGCGAKVGGAPLAEALSGLADPTNPEIVTGVGDDSAIVKMPGGGFQVLSTDHLRAMVHDPVQMTRIAAVHALGDIWAMGAAPQVALSSLILPRMSPALQARTLREITDTARKVFDASGASLVGGHTTMGAELTIGFTVTGTRDTMPISIAGAHPDDVLVLTRPIGSGVIMAAHMEGTASGREVANALAIMEQSQSQQAEILRDAHAMTDVTGFGLAGHVLAICKASGLGAVLTQSDIPFYKGARTLSDAGAASSLLPANRKNAPTQGIDDPLMHDPQTAGGLLAAMPQAVAENALSELQNKGLQGWIIGRLQRGLPTVTIT
ncbi:selenide, water dikinase SelD [Sulfitobacter marinus]|nr:selenide, water dikinase SelD [Sulfitobacter marinus]